MEKYSIYSCVSDPDSENLYPDPNLGILLNPDPDQHFFILILVKNLHFLNPSNFKGRSGSSNIKFLYILLF